MVYVSPGSAETLVARGGITNHRSIVYSLSNIYAESYQIWLIWVEAIVCNISVVFWHSVDALNRPPRVVKIFAHNRWTVFARYRKCASQSNTWLLPHSPFQMFRSFLHGQCHIFSIRCIPPPPQKLSLLVGDTTPSILILSSLDPLNHHSKLHLDRVGHFSTTHGRLPTDRPTNRNCTELDR